MSLTNEYKQQFKWRDWPTIFDALPALAGQTILDLGCGVGDLAAEFVSRGARVVGVDTNEELLREARSRRLRNTEFRTGDLRALPEFEIAVDGLWCSFAAAYCPALPSALDGWAKTMKSGAWIALTEIDDLFGHEPLSARTKKLFKSYADAAFAAGAYDFHMGRKLQAHLEGAGFSVSKVFTVEDPELSFSGPARPDVLDAWRSRFNRMRQFRDFCGTDIDRVQEEFLDCLLRADHESVAKVYCCIATLGRAHA